MNEMIIETIRKYEAPGDFTHTAVSSKMIATAEHVLKIKLPEQYINDLLHSQFLLNKHLLQERLFNDF